MRPRDRPKAVYTVCGVCYFRPDEFEQLVNLVGIVRHWCCIWHHSDKNDDGTPKEPHLHYIVTLFYQHSLKSFKRKFDFYIHKLRDKDTTLLCEACASVKESFDYLTHKHDLDKFLYRDEEIVSDNIYKWRNIRDGNANEEFFLDIGQLTRVQMAYKYGRDYMKNYKAYEDFYREAIWEETKKLYDYSLKKEENQLLSRSDDFSFPYDAF